MRINTAWGFIDIHIVTPERGDSSEITLIQQGIAAELKHLDEFPNPDEHPEFYVDFGETGPYEKSLGESECAV